jgi:hypothetical protein
LRLASFTQLGLDCILEDIKGLGTNDRDSIDQEAGCALHANLATKITFRLHQVFILIAGQALRKFIGVQVKLLGKISQVFITESTLVFTVLGFEE